MMHKIELKHKWHLVLTGVMALALIVPALGVPGLNLLIILKGLVGLPLIAIIPGWMWVPLLFPNAKGWGERLIYSVLLSMVFVGWTAYALRSIVFSEMTNWLIILALLIPIVLGALVQGVKKLFRKS